MIIDEIRSPIRSALRSPIGPSRGTTFSLDATGAQIRAAILDPASYVTDGWRLPGLGGARIRANARSSVAMQQRVDAAWEFAPHNLLRASENVADALWVAAGGASVGNATTVTLTAGFNTGTLRQTITGAAIGMTYTASAVLSGSGVVALTLQDNAGAFGATQTIVTLTATPTRYTVARAATVDTVSGGINVGLFSADAGGARTATVIQWQINLGPAATAYVPTTTTAVYAPAIDWLTGIGAYGLRSEESRTNSVRNSACIGAVNGSPGTQPTNWSFDAAGMTRTITANVTLLGLPALDIRFNGTSSTGYITIYPDDYVGGAAVSQAWAFSAIAALSAGSIGSGLVTPYMADYSGATFLRQRTVATAAALPAGGTRFSGSGTTGASTDGVRGYLVIDGLSTVSAADFTIRIACPQLELGAFATSPILTYGAAATRARDIPIIPYTIGTSGTVVAGIVRGSKLGTQYVLGTNAGVDSVFVGLNAAGNALSWDESTSVAVANAVSVAAVARMGVAWASGARSVCLAGGTVATGAHNGNLGSSSQIIFGADDSVAGASGQVWITSVRAAQRRFTDAELQAVTA